MKPINILLSELDQNKFRSRVLNWLCSLQVSTTKFKMSILSDSSVFTSCFALFIFDLFGEVDKWSQKEKNTWIDYIASFQNSNSGYFIPDDYIGDLNTKPVQQLTCFCLSALHILKARPKHELTFLKQWQQPEDIYEYLKKIGCFKGISTTGNMAMFLAIFLTYQYEQYKDQFALDRLTSWFYWHDRMQNQSTGFWGNSLSNKYYAGFQNALHQFVIYNYWGRSVPNYSKIVDAVLSLSDHDGHFGIVPGGGGCYDYDAADILINCGFKRSYRKDDIEHSLNKLLFIILNEQKDDGGFCESVSRPFSLLRIMSRKVLRYIFKNKNPYLWYYRLRSTINASRRNNTIIYDHWTAKGRLWDQSDLWNTWFRCLTIAEIDRTFDESIRTFNWKFHKFIGLGFFQD